MSYKLKFTEQEVVLAMVLSYVHGNGPDTQNDAKESNVISYLDGKEANFLAFLFMAKDLNTFLSTDLLSDDKIKKYVEDNKSDTPNFESMKKILRYYGNNGKDVNTEISKIVKTANELKLSEINGVLTKAMSKNSDIQKYINEKLIAIPTGKSIFSEAHKIDYNVKSETSFDLILGSTVVVPEIGSGLGGGLNQSGGFIEESIALLLRITMRLNINGDRLYKERSVYGAVVSTVLNVAKEIAKINVPSLSNVAVSTLGNKLYTVDYDTTNKKISVKLNNAEVEDSIINVTNGMYEKIGININQPRTPLLLSDCSRTKDASGCFKKLAELLDKEDKVIPENDFNTVNPRLVIEMLETLRWPWKMSSNNGTAVRKYAETYAEFEEFHKKRRTVLPVIADIANKNTVVTFLQRCVQYINGSYPELINDATFMELKEKETTTKELMNKGIEYVSTGYARDARGLLNSTFGPWSNNIVARNNSIARLQPGLNQLLMPPMAPIMVGRGQDGGSIDGQYGGQLYMFYDNTIERLISAMKVAGKQIDQQSQDKINRSKNEFKKASEDFTKILDTLHTYKNVNTLMKDSKSQVSLEDMERYNERFQSSLNTLNKSEVKLAKVISKLQEAMIKTFNVNLSGDEMTV
jgi:chaperonin cofactor prefoldin